ncbi:hypothetical protein DL93DRAFT_2094012 [Clavulina sp. PMI_390]|nr:hypothetical protein DL93DRAFT_2094012 [Clavulina sp. PMI_390]
MYYPQPRPQSPTRQLLHDPSVAASVPWSRLPHPMLSGGGAPPQSQNGVGVVNGPQQASYGLVQYTNGSAHHTPGLVPHHHHHQSISYIGSHYQSPGHLHASHRQQTVSPPPQPPVNYSKHWQLQLDHAESCRKAKDPHSRAKTAATTTRNAPKSVLSITDPNAKPMNGNTNGTAGTHSAQNSISETSEAFEQNHPSSTVPPVASPPAPRPLVPRKPESSWNALDLGGMMLKNLAPPLFRYDHLTTLYLNHNALTHVPPAISHLSHLTVLDLSGNLLESLPAELGLCSTLEHLWLFDNKLQNLPYELGSLHQLKLLGVEGNPLQSSLLNMVQNHGTPHLIAYLRDSCPAPPPPPERLMKDIRSEADRKMQESDPYNDTFSILSFNILCERAATPAMYGYTPNWALAWPYRKELILNELKLRNPDFLCLQEVDAAQYEEYFYPALAERGYEGVVSLKSRHRNVNEAEKRLVDGCAIFYRPSKYRLIKERSIDYTGYALQRSDLEKTNDMFSRLLARDDVALVLLFENKLTGSRLIVSNTHLYWNPASSDVKLTQTGLLLDHLKATAADFASIPVHLPGKVNGSDDPASLPPLPPIKYAPDGRDIPMVVAGDYNSIMDSGVFQLITEGQVPSDHPDFLQFDYGNFTSKGLSHDLGLRSAYADAGEIAVTNYVPTFRHQIDHIFYNGGSLAVNKVMSGVDPNYFARIVGLPNAHFPSE